MTPEVLKEIIDNELRGSGLDSWHGFTKENIFQFLIDPIEIPIESIDGQILKYWLVFDEKPSDLKEGYRVVYDEREKVFGLATKYTIEKPDTGFLLGLYGSFVDSLNSM